MEEEPLLPPGFCWGAATSAFQIEGAWNVDGKGPSVWDTIAHRPGGLAGGASGDVTCDHYHRLEEDLALIATLGITSYRFSVSWPRVQPDGKGRWNNKGLDFYQRLVDGLCARGVEPTVTLYHWDHPQALEDAGGWLNRNMAERFADYAEGIAAHLGDRVARWITLNEPHSVLVGHMLGFSRPAGALGLAALPVAHNLLLAHGLGLARLKGTRTPRPVGIALDLTGVEAGSEDPADIAAAARAEVFEDRLFLDPLLRACYPDVDGRPLLEADAADFAVIAAPLDFLGVNWYAPARVVDPSHADQRGRAQDGVNDLTSLFAGLAELLGYARVGFPDAPTNQLGGPILPERLGVLLRWLKSNYPNLPPIYMTENGLPHDDFADETGAVPDPDRISYVRRCVTALREAIVTASLDVRGYFVWSLMDNLEWGLGFEPRFGLVHVDFETLERTPKASFGWYRDLIANQPPADR